MKLADNTIDIEKNENYSGEKYGRSNIHSHGELLAIIDFKKKRITLHTDEFNGTKNTMEKNQKLAGAEICVDILVILLGIFIFFFTEDSGVFGFVFRIILLIGIFNMVYKTILSTIKYMIHKKGSFSGYASKKKIIPACKAISYCERIVAQLHIKYEEILKIEKTLTQEKEADFDDIYNRLNAIDVEPETIYDVIL